MTKGELSRDNITLLDLLEAYRGANKALVEVVQGLFHAQTTAEVEKVRQKAIAAIDPEYLPEAWKADAPTKG